MRGKEKAREDNTSKREKTFGILNIHIVEEGKKNFVDILRERVSCLKFLFRAAVKTDFLSLPLLILPLLLK